MTPILRKAKLTLAVMVGSSLVVSAQEGKSMNAVSFKPLTDGQRAKEYLKSVASPLAFLGSAASAGIGQWRDKPREWKQGGAAYGWRYSSAFAQHFTKETLRYGLAALTHEEPRYLRSSTTGFRSRLVYALESTVLTRGDDGQRHFAIANVGAIAGASLISRAWQPPSTSGMKNAGSNFGISIGIAAGVNVAREFLKK